MIATLTVNPTIDESASVDRVIPERKLRLTEPAREPGGGGLNVARAARELGEEVLAIFTSGGHSGRLLEELVAADEVPSRPVRIAGATRTSLVVHETSTGLQYRFGVPGPGLGERELEEVLAAIRGVHPAPRFLVASGSLNPGVDPGFYGRIARAVDPGRTRVVLDTSGEPLRRGMAAGVFLVKPNLRELATLAGRELLDDAAIQEAACELVARSGVEVVLASLGAGGAVLAWRGGCERLHAPTVPIRSKVGAGDSTVAGVVVALCRGLSVPGAARYGVAAGSAAVMTPGTELCRRGDVERLYREIDEAPARPATD